MSKCKKNNEKGAVAVVTAITLALILGFAALAIDIGYLFAARNELQNIADASALAAARQLGKIYTSAMSPSEQQSYNPYTHDYWPDEHALDVQTIKAAAHEVAGVNPSLGLTNSFALNDADIVVGKWDPSIRDVDPNPSLIPFDAVRVIARRDQSQNGPVSTFFASIFSFFGATDPEKTDVSAIAVASLGGQSTALPGTLELPVGISEYWFSQPGYCDQPIRFYPTGDLDGCAGWHTYDSWPANASKLSDMLTDLTPDPPLYESPEVIAGETEFMFTGGTLASAFDEMKALYDAKKDPVTNEWETTVPVYGIPGPETADCSNPNGAMTILGFATVVITEVLEAPDKIINAKVICETVSEGRGSGPSFTGWGDIPGLVR